jgi:hypothetical protein
VSFEHLRTLLEMEPLWDSTEFSVLVALADKTALSTGVASASYEELAYRAGLSRRGVIDIMARLERQGWFERAVRPGASGNKSGVVGAGHRNTFHVKWPATKKGEPPALFIPRPREGEPSRKGERGSRKGAAHRTKKVNGAHDSFPSTLSSTKELPAESSSTAVEAVENGARSAQELPPLRGGLDVDESHSPAPPHCEEETCVNAEDVRISPAVCDRDIAAGVDAEPGRAERRVEGIDQGPGVEPRLPKSAIRGGVSSDGRGGTRRPPEGLTPAGADLYRVVRALADDVFDELDDIRPEDPVASERLKTKCGDARIAYESDMCLRALHTAFMSLVARRASA